VLGHNTYVGLCASHVSADSRRPARDAPVHSADGTERTEQTLSACVITLHHILNVSACRQPGAKPGSYDSLLWAADHHPCRTLECAAPLGNTEAPCMSNRVACYLHTAVVHEPPNDMQRLGCWAGHTVLRSLSPPHWFIGQLASCSLVKPVTSTPARADEAGC